MQLTVSYEETNDQGTDSFEEASRYDSPDFDISTVELHGNTYFEYDDSILMSASGTNLKMVVQHHKGDSTRYENVSEVTRTTQSLCIKQSNETNPVYLPPTDTILWIAE